MRSLVGNSTIIEIKLSSVVYHTQTFPVKIHQDRGWIIIFPAAIYFISIAMVKTPYLIRLRKMYK